MLAKTTGASAIASPPTQSSKQQSGHDWGSSSNGAGGVTASQSGGESSGRTTAPAVAIAAASPTTVAAVPVTTQAVRSSADETASTQEGSQQQQAKSHAQEADGAPAPDGSFVMKATSSFEPTGSNMVAVQAGDYVQVLERHSSGWTYCKNISHASSSSGVGWAPSWIVQPVQQAAAPAAEAATAAKSQESARTPQTSAPSVKQQVLSQQPQPQQPQPQQPQQQAGAAAVAPVPKATAQPQRTVMRATAAFNATSSAQLTVALQELVEVIERHASGWTYGRRVNEAQVADSTPLEGWFPDWVVCAQK